MGSGQEQLKNSCEFRTELSGSRNAGKLSSGLTTGGLSSSIHLQRDSLILNSARRYLCLNISHRTVISAYL
jgi:hypothetical protein